MDPKSTQKALMQLGPMTEDWVEDRRNEQGVCEALCLDWLSKRLARLPQESAPSERADVAIRRLQEELERKNAYVAAHANDKAAANVRDYQAYEATFRTKLEAALKAIEERYSAIGVTCWRIPNGSFETLDRPASVLIRPDLAEMLATIDAQVEQTRQTTVTVTNKIKQMSETAGAPIDKANDLTPAQRSKKGYKHVIQRMKSGYPALGDLKAAGVVEAQYTSAGEFASALSAREFPNDTGWMITLDTPEVKHAMACSRSAGGDLFVVEPNLGVFNFSSARDWTGCIPILSDAYGCRRHQHRAVLFNRLA